VTASLESLRAVTPEPGADPDVAASTDACAGDVAAVDGEPSRELTADDANVRAMGGAFLRDEHGGGDDGGEEDDVDDDDDDEQDGTDRADERGFTLLEVLIAVAILAMSLTSLLASQVDSMRALRYANGLTLAAYLAEYQLIEIEWKVRRDGWVRNDLEFDGDFGELDHDEIRYECLVDFVEIPEFSQILNAQSDARAEGGMGSGSMLASSGGQAFGAAGMVWPLIKAAIENSVRKASCKALWNDGREEHVVEVQTFWTDLNGLTSLPGMGGEFTGADDDSGEGTGAPGTGTGTGSGAPTPSRPQGLGGLGGM